MLTPKRAGYGVLNHPHYTREFDTVSCTHCNKAFIVRSSDPNNKAVKGGWCGKCHAPTCPDCMKKECTPFLVKLKKMEARDRLMKELNE